MRLSLAFGLFMAATPVLTAPAFAGVDAVLDSHILPGTAAFAEAAQALDASAAADCQPTALQPAWNAAMDAWMGIGHLRLGPQEQATLTIAFWPDSRNSGRRTLARMIESEDPMGLETEDFAQVSAAARGLYALETMLYDPQFNAYDSGSYECSLVQVMVADLAEQATDLNAAWLQKFAPELRNAGAPDNALFLSEAEAEAALFTQLHGGVEFNADQRLGQVMGTPERPAPTRAETWRSGRSLRNLTLSMDALHRMATALAETPIPAVDEAFASVAYFAGAVEDPAFQDVADPMARLRLESLQGRIRAVGDALSLDIGEAMGIAPGFNSLDGD
ncbi:imelysin family protein [Rhodobacter sp. NTK016B]|uniref:imelysin family protein n=1 Tax=Rhodobacter sp. NTK016B TaxID=2759676 RepID=UPI001A8D3AB4|nr:imelysin family protein [Rhodobacter sp. NTK016B]MBN8293971.1 imelysin family protein [Rhodobacter sp. NTK016B]